MRTNQEVTVNCRRVDDFQFIGEFDLSYVKESDISVSNGDTLLAVYNSHSTFAFYDSLVQQNDVSAPDPINDLQIVSSGANQIKLKWTAAGDDGSIGTAFKYDLRFSYSPILNESDYYLAERYVTNFYPAQGGLTDSIILNLKNLTASASHDTVYFSIKAEDDMQNRSSLGNYAHYYYLISPDSVIASVFNVYKVNIDWSEINQKDWGIEEKADANISKSESIKKLDDYVTVPLTVSEKDKGIVLEGAVTINHYKVYRRIDNNAYVIIADSVTSATFVDNVFSSPDGIYKYGIKAVYSNGSESEMAASNSLTMNRFTNLRILCTIQDTSNYSNINLFMEGLDTVYHQIYSRTTNSTGLILIDNVYQTQYRLELSKPGNETIVKTISVADTSNEFSYTLTPFVSCNIQVVLEGLYNVSLDTLNMEDTVKVYLRNSFSPYAVVDSAVSTIPTQPFKFTGLFKFQNAPSRSYYIVVKPRNGIETWSKAGGVQLTKGIVANYNFTTSSSQAYGNNMVLKGTKWCIYSGDVNQDGIIDAQDLAALDNDINNTVAGYVSTDVNGDNTVNSDDMDIIYNNSFKFISIKKPSDVIIMKSKEQEKKTNSQ